MKMNTENNMVTLSEQLPDSNLSNEDIRPTKIEQRTWTRWDIASLWIGMAVCIPTYMLAASLLNEGMNWWQAILTILLGNAIVLIPMILNAHPGTKYGIPFPVLTRASFGTKGAHIPSLLRSLVACGWFGIQTWIGGLAIYIAIKAFFPQIETEPMAIGINPWQFFCFMIFWVINMVIILAGIESIRWLENYVAPILIVMGVVLLVWAISAVGLKKTLDKTDIFTKSPVVIASTFSSPQIEMKFNVLRDEENIPRAIYVKIQEEENVQKFPYNDQLIYTLKNTEAKNVVLEITFLGKEKIESTPIIKKIKYDPEKKVPVKTTKNFWLLFFPLLTAIIGFWATLSLNIPDFTRYASSQKEHLIGQLISLPPTMAFYSFIGLVATSASVILFSDTLIAKDAPWNPMDLLAKIEQPFIVLGAMIFVAIATLSTNLAANVVAPANGFSNLWPEKISFKVGGIITGIIGIVICPWKLIQDTQGYIFTWLIGYSALLGPIAGIVIADYFLIRKTKLNLLALYQEEGEYSYKNGVNSIAILALVFGVLPNIPGFLKTSGFVKEVPMFFMDIYIYAWFVGFFIALVFYTICMSMKHHVFVEK